MGTKGPTSPARMTWLVEPILGGTVGGISICSREGCSLWPHASHLPLLLTNVLRLWWEKLSIKQLPPTAVEGLCAAKFRLKALVGSGGTAGAAAQSMMDFNTSQRLLRMKPGEGSPCPACRPLGMVGGRPICVRLGSFSLCMESPSAPTASHSRVTGGGCHSAVGPGHGEICQQF